MGMTIARALVGAFAVGISLAAGTGPRSSPQAHPVQPSTQVGDRIAIGSGDISRYEVMYGSPQFRTLDADVGQWPLRTAIRTVGRLETIPGRGKSGAAASAPVVVALAWDNQYARHQLCGEGVEGTCLAIVPVEQMRDVLDGSGSAWLHKNVEVIGAIDALRVSFQAAGPLAFQVWSVFEAPDAPARKDGSKSSTLEPLVRYPEGAEGRVVTVSGVFRGSNLFEDLPPGSRRRATDWVLQDGPFSIWVTGKAPKGSGWSLDPQSRSDCAWRLEVKGTAETAGSFIYLRAKTVQLLGRTKNE